MKKIINSLVAGVFALSMLVIPFAPAQATTYTYSLSKSAEMPESQFVETGTDNFKIAEYNLYTREDVMLQKIILNVDGLYTANDFDNFTIVLDGQVLGQAVLYKGHVQLYVPSGYAVLEKGKTSKLSILANINDIAQNGNTFKVTVRSIDAVNMMTAKKAYGLVNIKNLYSNTMSIYNADTVTSKLAVYDSPNNQSQLYNGSNNMFEIYVENKGPHDVDLFNLTFELNLLGSVKLDNSKLLNKTTGTVSSIKYGYSTGKKSYGIIFEAGVLPAGQTATFSLLSNVSEGQKDDIVVTTVKTVMGTDMVTAEKISVATSSLPFHALSIN